MISENLCHDDNRYLSLWRGLVPVPGSFRLRKDIMREIARKHGLTMEALEMPSSEPKARLPKYVIARQESMWTMRQIKRPDGTPRYSFPLIGQIHGNRDHTTAMAAISAHQKRLDAASCEDTETV